MHSDKMYAILSKGHPLEAKSAQIGEFSLEWLAGQTLLCKIVPNGKDNISFRAEKRHIQPAEILESSNIRAALHWRRMVMELDFERRTAGTSGANNIPFRSLSFTKLYTSY
ncbi:MAG: hypothetical protein ACLVJH_19195 [Faecalibacterium prausnitzii]